VWVGFDKDIGMRDKLGNGITGGRAAAPIWADFMIKATDGEPPREFSVPADIRFEKVNPISGLAAGVWTRQPVQVALRAGKTIPKEFEFTANASGNASPASENPAGVPEKSTSVPQRSAIIEEDLAPDRR
jgi:membrane carboxypeptidase/penicillin-binding protein